VFIYIYIYIYICIKENKDNNGKLQDFVIKCRWEKGNKKIE
jgi:hypothetical protein